MSVSGATVSKMPIALAVAGRVLPLLPLQILLAICLREIRNRHPQIFDRLGDYCDKTFALVPTDLPFAFVLEPRRLNPRVFAVRSLPDTDVRISGSFAALISLADGTSDGDALFFSREIQIEGDMEAALALRNAIDDSRIDIIAEAAAWLGPLSPMAQRVLRDVINGSMWSSRDPAPERGSWN